MQSLSWIKLGGGCGRYSFLMAYLMDSREYGCELRLENPHKSFSNIGIMSSLNFISYIPGKRNCSIQPQASLVGRAKASPFC